MPKIPFPYATETNSPQRITASAIFFARSIQAIQFIQIEESIDPTGRTPEDIRTLQELHILIQEPRLALGIFLSVVNLEDFIRQICIELSDYLPLQSYFQNLKDLVVPLKKYEINNPTKRLDGDPFILLDFKKLNTQINNIFWISVIDTNEENKLNDLALIRHIIAHKGSTVRSIDLRRFQYYDMKPDVVINPPIEFVQEIQEYLREIWLGIHRTIRDKIFETITNKLNFIDFEKKPKILVDIIKIFNYFDLISTLDIQLEDEIENIKLHEKHLIDRCLTELQLKYYP